MIVYCLLFEGAVIFGMFAIYYCSFWLILNVSVSENDRQTEMHGE
jgi:hypothetical protein